MMSCIDLHMYVIAKLIVLWSLFYCHSAWNKSMGIRFKSVWWQIGLRCFQIDVFSKQNMHGRSVQQSSVLATLAHHGVTLLPCFFTSVSMTDHHHFIIIFENVHGPTSLALSITSVTTMLYSSVVSFTCFQLVLLTSARPSIPELYKVWQSSLEAHHSSVAVETQGVDSPKHYLHLVLLPIALSPWWSLPPPLPHSWQSVNFVFMYLLNSWNREL